MLVWRVTPLVWLNRAAPVAGMSMSVLRLGHHLLVTRMTLDLISPM